MWYCLVATAKEHATPQTIAAKRHQWVAQGKDLQLAAKCRTTQRYVVEQASPPKVFWLIETDDQAAVDFLIGHFGDLWDIQNYQVTPQVIGGAPRP